MNVPDGIFLPVSAVNRLRRQALENLRELLTAPRKAEETGCLWQPPVVSDTLPPLMVQIQKPGQRLETDAVWMSEFSIPGTVHKAALTEDSGEITAHLGQGRILDGMNISNSWAIAAAQEMGYAGVVLSEEMSEGQIRSTLQGYEQRYGTPAPAAAVVYQKRRLMLMDHCPVNTLERDGSRTGCSLCRRHSYVLQGMDGTSQQLYGNPFCHMQVFADEADNRLEELADLPFKVVRFTTETPQEAAAVMAEITRLQGVTSRSCD